MGVTTAFSGNCGLSPVDFPSFFAEFKKNGYPINQAEQAGHTELRKAVGQHDEFVPLSGTQKEKLKSLMKESFAAGAAGFSFGLEYVPGAPPEEVLELAQVAAAAGKIVSIHSRLNTFNDTDSLKEALDVSVITGTRLIFSHLVYMYTGDGLKRAVDIIDKYRHKGADIWVDSGMYTAFASYAGTPLFDEEILTSKGFHFKKLRAGTGKYAGQYLDLEKLREIRRDFPNDSLIYDPGKPEDIFTAFALADVMVSTDCIKYPPGQGHPQGAATYPYFFRVLVKEQGKIPLLEALRRCSFIPAQALGYSGKGRIAEGADADLLVLDWERLRERADFAGTGNPDARPEGVRYVFVNGVLSIEDEKRIPGVYAGTCL
jgi:N-acyl-D-amino-acid deacylase